jgi:hypothetical protein
VSASWGDELASNLPKTGIGNERYNRHQMIILGCADRMKLDFGEVTKRAYSCTQQVADGLLPLPKARA